jgi:chromate transporter
MSVFLYLQYKQHTRNFYLYYHLTDNKKISTVLTAREYLFLRNVFIISVSAFGGPQAHLTMFHKIFVEQQRYLTDLELVELNALCQILPGPTSTQTIIALGFRKGGAKLAYLTLLVWALPACVFMTFLGIFINHFSGNGLSLDFAKYIQPMAIGFVAYGAYKIIPSSIKSGISYLLVIGAALLGFFFRSPYIFPIVIFMGGLITGLKFRSLEKKVKTEQPIEWANFFLYVGVFVIVAVLGGISKSLPIRLFENFYRNGSLIFGGGQVLAPLLFTEFVEYKKYLTAQEFLTGYSIVQALPGPLFSFAAYVGALSMREYGLFGEILGGFMCSLGIFLPGTFLIFFFIRFWERLKQYRAVQASLAGITASSAGLMLSATFLLAEKVEFIWINYAVIVATFLLLVFTRISSFWIVFAGIAAGLIF